MEKDHWLSKGKHSVTCPALAAFAKLQSSQLRHKYRAGGGGGWAPAPTSSICLDGLHPHQQLSWTVWSFLQRAVAHLPIHR